MKTCWTQLLLLFRNEDGGSGGGIAYPHGKPQLAFDILPLANLDHDDEAESASQTVPLNATKIAKAHKEARDAQCLTDPLKKPPALVKALYDAQREKQDAWNDVAFLEIALTPVEAAKSPQGGGGVLRRPQEKRRRKPLGKPWRRPRSGSSTSPNNWLRSAAATALSRLCETVVSVDVPSEDKEKIKSTQRACDASNRLDYSRRDGFYGSGFAIAARGGVHGRRAAVLHACSRSTPPASRRGLHGAHISLPALPAAEPRRPAPAAFYCRTPLRYYPSRPLQNGPRRP